MGHMTQMQISDAIALIRPSDTLAVPLGPGVPGAFMHALGDRTDFVDLQIFFNVFFVLQVSFFQFILLNFLF